MAHMPSTELTARQHTILLRLARESVVHGLANGCALPVDPEDYDEALQRRGASFVTLKSGGQLRGCIGALEAYRPLVVDVGNHAWAAAFTDTRFSPLARAELEGLRISISVLSPPEPIGFSGEEDLLRQLRPNVDGVILEEGALRATFLPGVWESLPERAAFLQHLRLKARLPANYWSDTLRVSRYVTESFAEEV